MCPCHLCSVCLALWLQCPGWLWAGRQQPAWGPGPEGRAHCASKENRCPEIMSRLLPQVNFVLV